MDVGSNGVEGYTTKQAAEAVGVSETRIRQLVGGNNPIDHKYILGRIVVSIKGVNQAKQRNKTLGRPSKAVAVQG